MKITNEYLGMALLVIGVLIPIVAGGMTGNPALQLISGVVGVGIMYTGVCLSNQKDQSK